MEGRDIRKLLQNGVDQRIFPGAEVLVAHNGRIVRREHSGYRALIPRQFPVVPGTLFDLASLTKPLATTLAVMKLVNDGKISLDQSLGEMLADASLRDKRDLTLRLLLSHSAGLVDWKPFYEKLMDYPLESRKKLLRRWIIEGPFAYEPLKGNLYSDLGFMLLEWVIEEKTGETLPAYVHEHFYGPLGLKKTFFTQPPISSGENENERGGTDNRVGGIGKRGREDGKRNSRLSQIPPAVRGNDAFVHASDGREHAKEEFAATEDCPWRKRVLQGEVHDDNAWSLGGHSGHAGLFGTAEEVYVIANMLREHFFGIRGDFFKPETVREFFRRQELVSGSDWALGWDTRALEGSSAGKHFGRDSVGHTGFTGTSLWMDLEKDVIAILLTNRVHPKRDNDAIKRFRPAFHDAVMEALGYPRV